MMASSTVPPPEVSDLHLPRTPISRTRSLLLAVGGTNRVILDKCPTELEHRTALGVAVVVPTVLATVGAWIALTNLNTNPAAATIGALAVGAVVFAVDRLMVTAPATRLTVAGRAVMTLAMAWLIGEQLLVVTFAPEIRTELAVMAAEDLNERTTAITAATDAELARIDARLTEFTATDPERAGAVERLDEAEARVREARAEVERLQVALREEIAGTALAGSTGQSGDGPAAEVIRAQIDLAVIDLDEATSARDTAAQTLATFNTSTDTSADEVARLTDQRAQVEADRGKALDQAAAEVAQGGGVLARIEALERLAQSPLMAAQVWALRLLLLAVDTLPLTVKLAVSRRPNPYDVLTDAYRQLAFTRADHIRNHQPTTPTTTRTGPSMIPPTGGRNARALVAGRIVPIDRRHRKTPDVDEHQDHEDPEHDRQAVAVHTQESLPGMAAAA